MKKIFIFILLFSFNTIYAFKTDKELTEYYQKIENKLTEEIHKIPKNINKNEIKKRKKNLEKERLNSHIIEKMGIYMLLIIKQIF